MRSESDCENLNHSLGCFVHAADLFNIATNDPLHDWAALAKDVEACEPSLLKVWIELYDRWKHGYQRFRDYEETLLFTVPEGQKDTPALDERIMRYHRRVIFALLSSGERCLENLQNLPIEDDNEMQERLVWVKRIRTLLESLQETLELWHPVNVERAENGGQTIKLTAAS